MEYSMVIVLNLSILILAIRHYEKTDKLRDEYIRLQKSKMKEITKDLHVWRRSYEILRKHAKSSMKREDFNKATQEVSDIQNSLETEYSKHLSLEQDLKDISEGEL